MSAGDTRHLAKPVAPPPDGSPIPLSGPDASSRTQLRSAPAGSAVHPPLAEQRALHKRALIARGGMLRAGLVLQAAPAGHALVTLDAGLRIATRIGRHPGWLAAFAVALAAIRPRRLSSLLRVASGGLRGWRQVAPLLQTLRSGG